MGALHLKGSTALACDNISKCFFRGVKSVNVCTVFYALMCALNIVLHRMLLCIVLLMSGPGSPPPQGLNLFGRC